MKTNVNNSNLINNKGDDTMDIKKVSKKAFKSLSKSEAYNKVYEPIFAHAINIGFNLEQANIKLDEAEEQLNDVRVRLDKSNEALDELEVINKEQKVKIKELRLENFDLKDELDDTNEKLDEARAFQEEAQAGFKLIQDQINKFTNAEAEAKKSKANADEEFNSAMADTLNRKALNSSLAKVEFKAEGTSPEDLEALKVLARAVNNEISENNRQIALNKETMQNAKSKSFNADRKVNSCGLNLEMLKAERDEALRKIGEYVVNGSLKL